MNARRNFKCEKQRFIGNSVEWEGSALYLFEGKNKAGSLPLSCPPSRFLSYPKIPLSGKMFVIDEMN